MLIEWIICKLKDIFLFAFKTSFTLVYTLFFEIWTLILKYPKLWMGMLFFFLTSLLSIKHCKLGFFINYKEHVVNHNYPSDCNVQHRYFFNRKMLEEIFRSESKIISDYVKEDRKNTK